MRRRLTWPRAWPALAALACASTDPDFDRPYTAGLANIDRLEIDRSQIDLGKIQIHVQGTLPDSCTRIGSIERDRWTRRIEVRIETRRDSDPDCRQEPSLFQRSLVVNTAVLPAGIYTVDVNGSQAIFHVDRDPWLLDPGGELELE